MGNYAFCVRDAMTAAYEAGKKNVRAKGGWIFRDCKGFSIRYLRPGPELLMGAWLRMRKFRRKWIGAEIFNTRKNLLTTWDRKVRR
jgi:hypothetical protein